MASIDGAKYIVYADKKINKGTVRKNINEFLAQKRNIRYEKDKTMKK